MFEPPPRRHPLQTFQFWFCILLTAGAATAWKFDLLPLGSRSGKLPVISAEPMPPPPADIVRMREPEIDSPLPEVETPLQEVSLPEQAEPLFPPQQAEADRPDTMTLVPDSGTPDDSDQGVRLASAERSVPEVAAPAEPPLPAPETEVATEPVDLRQADQLIDSGEDVAAHRLLSSWYWQYPKRRDEFHSRLVLLSRRIYFQPKPHYLPAYEVRFGDRLESIAANYQVTWEYLAKLNRVDPQKLRPGEPLKVIQGPFGCIVDLEEFSLTVHAHGYYVARFQIGTGRDQSTPVGVFRVTDKQVDPTYYGPEGVVRHDDPQNPLGERWLAINDEQGTLRGIGIHGTIEPGTIGQSASHGCIRLEERDVALLYDLLTVGSEVVIRR